VSNKFLKLNNESGFVLIATLMVLVILTIIGLTSTSTTMTELMISGNDKAHRETFYQADGTTELSERILFENAVCYVTNGTGFDGNFGSGASISDNIVIEDIDFSQSLVDSPDDLSFKLTPSSGNRQLVVYPHGSIDKNTITETGLGGVNDTANPERTDILVEGAVGAGEGFNLSFISGYEGLAYGAAGGGVQRTYTVATAHNGKDSSQSLINVRWRLNTSVLNSASNFDCIY